MNYGLYLAAGGVLHNMNRQDVIANNLANVNTVAFKPDSVYTRHRPAERLTGLHPTVDPKHMLERLGGGLMAEPAWVSTRQGALTPTRNELDIAVDGEGYFTVRDGRGEERLTRDGQFALNDEGELVTQAGGLRVLDDEGRTIRLDRRTPVAVRTSGEIFQGEALVAVIRVVAPNDRSELVKAGHNLLRVNAGGTRLATGRLQQSHVESSAVDPVMALHHLINAAKAAQGNVRMMQYHDNIMGQAINTLGRVS